MIPPPVKPGDLVVFRDPVLRTFFDLAGVRYMEMIPIRDTPCLVIQVNKWQRHRTRNELILTLFAAGAVHKWAWSGKEPPFEVIG